MLISSKHFRRSFFKGFTQHQNKFGAGFTLIELIVVSAIIIVITTFILFQQSKFNSSTLLRSLAYSIALSVRQAQVYGTSVRESSLGSNIFSAGYGIHIPSAGVSSADTYYIFSDLDGNGKYDVGEELPLFKLGKGYMINNICGVIGTSCTTVSKLTIFFRRPNPEAFISDNVASDMYPAAFIQVKSTGNSDTRSVKISNTGQISVCQPNRVPPQC